MEEENTEGSVSEPTVYEIPIECYEEDMETESSKGKKDDILDLFANHNHLRSEDEFKEIESLLHYSCQKSDLELIKILLNETIITDSYFNYKIDKTNKTASLFYNGQSFDFIFIPRTVDYELNDYLVASVSLFS